MAIELMMTGNATSCIARILTYATGIPSNIVKMCKSRLTKKSDQRRIIFG